MKIAIDEALAALDGTDRAAKLDAIFKLGNALPALPASDTPTRAIERLEALAKDREAGSWIRKRAKRALGRIRGAGASAEGTSAKGADAAEGTAPPD